MSTVGRYALLEAMGIIVVEAPGLDIEALIDHDHRLVVVRAGSVMSAVVARIVQGSPHCVDPWTGRGRGVKIAARDGPDDFAGNQLRAQSHNR